MRFLGGYFFDTHPPLTMWRWYKFLAQTYSKKKKERGRQTVESVMDSERKVTYIPLLARAMSKELLIMLQMLQSYAVHGVVWPASPILQFLPVPCQSSFSFSYLRASAVHFLFSSIRRLQWGLMDTGLNMK